MTWVQAVIIGLNIAVIVCTIIIWRLLTRNDVPEILAGITKRLKKTEVALRVNHLADICGDSLDETMYLRAQIKDLYRLLDELYQYFNLERVTEEKTYLREKPNDGPNT